uniref:Uncharacterized protein n=1 Tax=Oryza brachyantha TaxID=4533 RepID=J3M204_ORYBR
MMNSGVKRRTDHIDIHNMVSSMRKEIDNYWSNYDSIYSVSNFYSIHKVPQHILGVDRTAYEPTILSIGPYHYGKDPLQAMEKEKWNCLNFILRSNCSGNLQDYLAAIAKCERRARSCYSEEIKMDKKKFLKMLLLDGCFVLVFLNGTEGNAEENPGTYEGCSSRQEIISETASRNSREPKERTVTQTDQESNGSDGMGGWYSCCLAHDLLLFENQIPFYIVEGIYELFTGTEMRTRFLADKIAGCMESILRHYPIAIQEFDRPKQFHHLLHLCHMYFRPSQKFEEHQGVTRPSYFYRLLHFGKRYISLGRKPEKNQQIFLQSQQLNCSESEHLSSRWRRWRRAVQYHEAGVTLKKREYDQENKHSLLDIRFRNGVIEIPCLPIDENSEALFKNFIALEQTDPRYGNDLTAYVWFMSQLVTTPDDAALLVAKGIIVHMMDSDEELSSLFTRLIKKVVIKAETSCYLNSLCTLENHYQSRINRWMAWLSLNHFSNPWLALAVLATVVMLVCTVVQTIFTVLAYVKPPQQL